MGLGGSTPMKEEHDTVEVTEAFAAKEIARAGQRELEEKKKRKIIEENPAQEQAMIEKVGGAARQFTEGVGGLEKRVGGSKCESARRAVSECMAQGRLGQCPDVVAAFEKCVKD